MKWLVNGACFVGLMMVFQSCMAVGNFLGLTSEAEKSKPEAVVLTAEEQKANDALWEAKQIEIAAKQKADAEAAKQSQRFAACTEMDKGGWPDRIGEVDYLIIARDAVDAMCPWHNDRVANMEAQRAVGHSNLSEAEKEAAVEKLWREADAAWANP